MFERFSKYRKWKQLIDIRTIEVRMSFIIVSIIVILSIVLRIYDNILVYKSALQSITLYFIGGFIALTGFVLSGIAIITSLFSKSQLHVIEADNPNSVTDILVSFEFLAFLSSMNVIILAIVYIGFNVPADIISAPLFYILSFLIMYIICLILLYTVALCGNCIRLYNISIDAERILQLESELRQVKDQIKQINTSTSENRDAK